MIVVRYLRPAANLLATPVRRLPGRESWIIRSFPRNGEGGAETFW